MCKKCFHKKYRVSAENGNIVCTACQDCTTPTAANEVHSVSPGPSQVLQALSSTSGGVSRQSSHDKSNKKLRGAAKKSKAAKIIKEREAVGDTDLLIETSELSYDEGIYIRDRHQRCNKAKVLKKRLHQTALNLNRMCGYSVSINAQAPLPATGPRAAGLKMDLEDINGDKASKTSAKNHADNISPVKVNRGFMYLDKVEGNFVKKLTPSKHRLAEARRNTGSEVISPTSGRNLSLGGQSMVDTTEDSDEEYEDPGESNSSTLPDILEVPCSSPQPLPLPTLRAKPLKKLFVPPRPQSQMSSSYNYKGLNRTDSCKNIISSLFLEPGSTSKNSRKIPYSSSFPLNINGLGGSKRSKVDIKEIDLDKESAAVCGICLLEKKSQSDIAFR